jgi:glycosyltransferase involved in cell wall biosynthesis
MRTVVIHGDSEIHGVAAYRYWIPCRWMQKYGFDANYIKADLFDSVFNTKDIDILISQRIAFSEKPKVKRIVYDVDDDLGDKERNLLSRSDRKNYLYTIRNSTAITVSTNYLKNKIEQYTDRPVFINPNLMDLNLFDKLPVMPNKPPIFGFVGGRSHYNDWKIAESFIMDIMNDNKEWHFYLVGFVPDYFKNAARLFKDRVVTFDYFVPYPMYIKILRQIDVRLSPLEDVTFNYSKSAIAALEMMACGNVSIAQNINVYREVISHKENGFLCDTEQDWYNTISAVLKDRLLRRRIGLNGKLYIQNNYNVENKIFDWINSYQTIMRL